MLSFCSGVGAIALVDGRAYLKETPVDPGFRHQFVANQPKYIFITTRVIGVINNFISLFQNKYNTSNP